jgi:hypothetical protein
MHTFSWMPLGCKIRDGCSVPFNFSCTTQWNFFIIWKGRNVKWWIKILEFANRCYAVLWSLQRLLDILHAVLAETHNFESNNTRISLIIPNHTSLLCDRPLSHDSLWFVIMCRSESLVHFNWISSPPPPQNYLSVCMWCWYESLVQFSCVRLPILLNMLHFNQNKLQTFIGIFELMIDYTERIAAFCK